MALGRGGLFAVRPRLRREQGRHPGGIAEELLQSVRESIARGWSAGRIVDTTTRPRSVQVYRSVARAAILCLLVVLFGARSAAGAGKPCQEIRGEGSWPYEERSAVG